ncbi:MAG: ABC transporter substrate-binding protein [Acetobacteraceae bacterium]|nr:ABC transporter substrate-binding protein [Acetobacteraceae bacterium]
MHPSTLRRARIRLVLLVAALLCAGPAGAQTLRIGVRAAMLTADPASSFNPDRGITLQVYEPLLLQDANLQPTPGLAVAWRMRDPTTWEVKLRPGVAFQDGSPLTPADVLFSINRIQTVEVTQSYRANLREVTGAEGEGTDTVVIHTRHPAPTLPFDLATFPILSARAAQGAAPEDFNGGRAAIGTGPYRILKWTPGQDVILERNPRYWGKQPQWERVEFRFIPNDSARVAGLLAGDLDLVDALPAELLDRVQKNEKLHVQSALGILMMYLQPDIGRAVTPYATGADGQVLPKNPLMDRPVRQAISAAINRQALAQRVMQGTAEPAGQLMAPGLDNHVPSLPPPSYDPAKAKALLADASYPGGFGLTLTCTNDRYPGDDRICQAVGQMLSAVGIRTKVDTGPMSILLRRRSGGGPDGKMDLSLYMIGYGAPNGLATAALSSLAETQDRAAGRGGNNFSGYSNPELDRLIHAAEQELDPEKRGALVEQATRLAIDDVVLVPLLFTKNYWGMRKGLTMTPRADAFSFAATVQGQ